MSDVDMLDLIATAPTDRGVAAWADSQMTRVARLISVGSHSVTVSDLDSDPLTVPAVPSTWTGATTCWLLIHPLTGRPVMALGPAGESSSAAGATAAPPVSESVEERVILPEWTGSWAGVRPSAYGATIGGGVRDVWQGATPTGTVLSGMADYGTQVVETGAATITSATLVLVGNGVTRGSWTARVQASPVRTAGPEGTGPVATGVVTGDGTTEIDVTPMASLLLAGHGLALTGTDYGGVRGDGQSMALVLSYYLEAI